MQNTKYATTSLYSTQHKTKGVQITICIHTWYQYIPGVQLLWCSPREVRLKVFGVHGSIIQQQYSTLVYYRSATKYIDVGHNFDFRHVRNRGGACRLIGPCVHVSFHVGGTFGEIETPQTLKKTTPGSKTIPLLRLLLSRMPIGSQVCRTTRIILVR